MTAYPAVRLELTPALSWANRLRALLAVLASMGLAAMWLRVRWQPFGGDLAWTGMGLGVIALIAAFSESRNLGFSYMPYGGSDEGIWHDNVGWVIAQELREGRIIEAVRGAEDVFFAQIGMRYLRALEHLLFGDTYLGYTLVLAILPAVLFRLLQCLFPRGWAGAGAVAFLLMPALFPFSFTNYVVLVKQGMIETAAAFLFLLGLLLILRGFEPWGASSPRPELIAVGGAALGLSVLVRVNQLVPVGVLVAGMAFDAWHRAGLRQLQPLAAGLPFVVFPGLHNILFGGQWFLFTSSLGVAMPISPVAYLGLFADVVTGKWDNPMMGVLSDRLVVMFLGRGATPGWLQVPVAVPVVAKSVILAVCGLGMLDRGSRAPWLPWLAASGLASFGFFFLVSLLTYRYIIFSWDLCAMIAAAVVFRRARTTV